MAEDPRYAQRLHPAFDSLGVEVVWAVRHEMARRVEDVLARRLRALLLDTRASIEMAPAVAELMAEELKRDAAWVRDQVRDFRALAEGLLLS
jgi:glycerol-3-phosphate dehydrogenase